MLVTVAGISIDVSELQYSNAYEPMLVSWLPSAKVTDVSELHSQNACQPMLVTEAGIVIVVSELQYSNA